MQGVTLVLDTEEYQRNRLSKILIVTKPMHKKRALFYDHLSILQGGELQGGI